MKFHTVFVATKARRAGDVLLGCRVEVAAALASTGKDPSAGSGFV
jgi:hypothetical protein